MPPVFYDDCNAFVTLRLVKYLLERIRIAVVFFTENAPLFFRKKGERNYD